jgi:spore coat polysaccharide biosynthesis protein SpsF
VSGQTAAIIQARMGSTRLPGKVLMKLNGQPSLAFMVDRLTRARTLDRIIVATSTVPADDAIADLCNTLSIDLFRGSECDVLGRYVGAARAFDADIVVRFTADCPFICPEVADEVIRMFHDVPEVDYATNCLRRTYPRGLDTEVVRRSTLERIADETDEPADREHVTYFIYRQAKRFRHLSVEDRENHSDLRWTVDTPEDFELVSRMAETLGANAGASSYRDLLAIFEHHPEWKKINAHIEQKRV